MIHLQINKVAFIGKGGVGLLYGSMIARALGNDAVEYVMDDARFERHANDAVTVNGKPARASYDVKVGDQISLRFGQRTVTVEVLDVQETVRQADAGALYREIGR